ncbi:hypothetical protein Tco_1338044 [Tanacetum coccineum]
MLMRSDELYKFYDGTLTSVRTVLHDIASNLRMHYLPKRRWSERDRTRSCIMIKVIDKQLFERKLMRNLEKFVEHQSDTYVFTMKMEILLVSTSNSTAVVIPLGQKNTLAEYMILSSANNRPPMLDKDLYDSWKSQMELYMQNREHRKMILESVENGPFIWPTVEENGVIKTNKYVELSAAEKIQADCDMKATNIIL